MNMANGLAERGHNVAVALHYPGGELEQRLENVSIIQLHKASRWDLLGFSFRLVCAVRSFGPDVVCSFLGTPNILISILKPLIRPARIVWSVRSSDMDLSQYDWAARVSYWLERKLSPLADSIMINSNAGKQYALSNGIAPDKIDVVYNGFDVNRFVPNRDLGDLVRREWGVSEDTVLVGLVARIDPMKDHMSFLEAVKILKLKGLPLRFVCVGDGGAKEELIAYAKESGVDDLVMWPGIRSDMPAVFNALDICCLSSVSEGFPNVLAEAMACNVPCVTTDVGDAAHVVGKTGIVVPVADPEALAAGLFKMVKQVRNGTINEPRQRIVEAFSLDALVEKTQGVLLGVLK